MEISSDMDECFRKVESSLALFQWRRRRYRVPLPQGCFIVSSHGADRPMSFGMQRAIRKIRQSLCLVTNTFAPVSQQPCVGENSIASIFSRGAACAVAQVKHNGMNHARRRRDSGCRIKPVVSEERLLLPFLGSATCQDKASDAL